jgi:hypothetical protein
MKWKKVADLGFRILIFGLLVFVVFFVINHFHTPKQNVVPAGAVAMNFPLKNGSFLVSSNGPSPGFLSGSVHQSPNEKFALDISNYSGINIKDMFASVFTHDLKSNQTFGTKIYSPCFGNIKQTSNDKPDMPIGTRDLTSGGNFVVLGCDGFDVGLNHMREGSVVVTEGQIVKSGDLLGEIGNSGNSTGPHLHLVATRTDGTGNVIPLPMTFDGRYLNKNDIIDN